MNDIRRRAGLGSFRHTAHRRAGSIVIGHQADHHTADGSGQRCPEDVQADAETGNQEECRCEKEQGGNDGRALQGGSRTDSVQQTHGGNADNRCGQSENGEDQRKRHQGKPGIAGSGTALSKPLQYAGSECGADGNRRDDGADVRFKNVGAHSGHVAHVVAYVVGDDAGIAGVVLRNSGLDFPHQVAADVGRLCIDTTADAREQRDGACPHGKAAQVVDRFGVSESLKEETHAQQTQAGNSQSHYRAAVEGHQQGRRFAFLLGGIGRASVGFGCRLHAEEPGQRRAERPADETERRFR